MTHDEARVLAERTARASYGRLLAILAAPTRDIEMAEDCLADAFEQALRSWPDGGVPANPEGWLLTVARNRQRDALRSAAHRTMVQLTEPVERRAAAAIEEIDPDVLPDRRLALLFVCAHPAIDALVRTPLMLQTVLGFDARSIARAFAIPEPTLAKRLVRAKRRIRDAGIPFSIPDRSSIASRLTPVLEAIYGAYAIDWHSFAVEAHYLAVTLAQRMPEEPETLGLAALLSLSLSRAAARSSPEFVPLEEQDTTHWDQALIEQGERYLRRASELRRLGRFQLEAAIQSVHCARASSGVTDWTALLKLYTALVALAPTLGAQVALAATSSRVDGPERGLAALDAISDPAVQRFQPAWATRAHLLTEMGRAELAEQAYRKAISLTTEPAVRHYLERKRAALGERRGGSWRS